MLMLAARTCDSCISLVTITELSALFHVVTIIKLLLIVNTNKAFSLFVSVCKCKIITIHMSFPMLSVK